MSKSRPFAWFGCAPSCQPWLHCVGMSGTTHSTTMLNVCKLHLHLAQFWSILPDCSRKRQAVTSPTSIQQDGCFFPSAEAGNHYHQWSERKLGIAVTKPNSKTWRYYSQPTCLFCSPRHFPDHPRPASRHAVHAAAFVTRNWRDLWMQSMPKSLQRID